MYDCDTVVVGSGAGGLTAGLALARAGQSVVVLEQHYLPGGWCHSFGLGGYRYSPGVHYLGALQEGGGLRRVWEGLGLGGDLTMLELNPDSYDQVRIGDRRFDWAAGRARRRSVLAGQLPESAAGIHGLFDDLESLGDGTGRLVAAQGPWDALRTLGERPALLRWGLRPFSHLLRHHLTDPLARAVLSVQCGDTGLGPGRLPSALHAAILRHYEEGAWYPLGGGGSIPKAYSRALKQAGSALKVKTSVEEIRTEPDPAGGRRAIGVRTADGQTLRARHVISNADPQVTFGALLAPSAVPPAIRKKLDRTRWSTTAVSLFFAAEIDPAAYGLDSGNLWYLDHPDIDLVAPTPADLRMDAVASFPAFFLTVTSAKDRTKVKGGVHTLEAFAMLPYRPFAPWAGTATGERPAAYAALKAHLQAAMIRSVAKVIPDIAERLVFAELGTPLTNRFYCRSTQGSLYGTEKTLMQLGPFGFGVDVPGIRGLKLCGASTLSHGVAGAVMSGLVAAGQVAECAPDDLLARQGPSIQLLPADRPEVWPAPLRRKAERAAAVRP